MAGWDAKDLVKAVVAATGWGDANPPHIDATLHRRIMEEGLGPLVGGQLERGASLTCDAGLADSLVEQHRICLAENLHREHLALPLFAAFNDRNIPSVLLKGSALVRMAYPSPGDRAMGDIDALVPESRWNAALAVARETGCIFHTRAFTERLDYAVQLEVEGGARIDLHRYLCAKPMFAPAYAEIFAGAVDLGAGHRGPRADHLFVALAIHAAKHGFVMPLRGLVDGLMLIARGVDPASVYEVASRWRARGATARWISLLGRVGLQDARWLELVDRLVRPLPFFAKLPSHIPRSRSGNLWVGEAELWLQALVSLDSPARVAATVADRGRLRLSNLLLDTLVARTSRTKEGS